MKKINKRCLYLLSSSLFIFLTPIVATSCSISQANGPMFPYDEYKYEITSSNYRSYSFKSNSYSNEIKDKNDNQMYDFLEITSSQVGYQWKNVNKFKEIITTHLFSNALDNNEFLKNNSVNYDLISSSNFYTTLEASEPSSFFAVHIKNDSQKIYIKFLLLNTKI